MGPKIIHMAYIIRNIHFALLENLKLEIKFEDIGTIYLFILLHLHVKYIIFRFYETLKSLYQFDMFCN